MIASALDNEFEMNLGLDTCRDAMPQHSKSPKANGLRTEPSALTMVDPRILLVTRNLPPLVGGMERLNWHMAEELSRAADVRVIGPVGAAGMAPKDAAVTEVPLRPLWRFLAMAAWRALCLARTWRPDIVLAGSGLTAPIAWFAAKLVGARAAVYVHGLDLALTNPIYRTLWLPFIRRMDRVIANSQATALLARRAGVSRIRIGIVHPGVELPSKVPDAEAVARFRAEQGLGERPLLLSVGRLTARKGLREFVTEALPLISAVRPDIILLIVGDVPSDALHAEAQTFESICAAAERAGVASMLRFLGAITDYSRLGVIYRAANVHVFPVREILGDPEGFGMVAIEAAAHGLPTVAFATGGVVDAVAAGESGQLIASGDYVAFTQAVIEVLASRERWTQPCLEVGGRFAWPAFGRALTEELRNEC